MRVCYVLDGEGSRVGGFRWSDFFYFVNIVYLVVVRGCRIYLKAFWGVDGG